MTTDARPTVERRASLLMVPAADEASLRPFRIVDARELGGWVVVNAETLRVVEPGYLWRNRERAMAWARRELDRLRRDAADNRRRQDDVRLRGLPQ
jgi:hypothetical protein